MSAITDRLDRALAGRYRLERELDAGGMAVVFAARDVRHERNVAIKVFRPELSAVLGAERFDAEIRITANLQHPHILPLFDSGSAEGLLFYVMPLVEGESLRARLRREKQLAVDAAVNIATQVANALEYAHRHGVIHRDIKPENILLQGDEVLVADFGIALALEQSGGSRLTETGLSLGTPQYMSPEQAMGERIFTAKTDIYSLGAVLYEMLAGEPPYTGPTVQAIVAKILMESPRPIVQLRPSTPDHVAAAIDRALARISADRLTAFEFAHAMSDTSDRTAVSARPRSGARPAPRWLAMPGTGLWVRRSVAAILVAAAGIFAGYALDRRTPDTASVPLRFTIPTVTPQLDRLLGQLPLLALAPDGSALVFTHEDGLLLRRLDNFDAVALPGTRDATTPVFSPDGQWLVFGQAGRLRKMRVDGGPITDIVTASYRNGAYWGSNDQIYFSAGLGDRGIWRVAAAGGVAQPVTTLIDSLGEVAHGWPQLLPGGRDLMFTIIGPSGGSDDARVVVETIVSDTRERKTLISRAGYARYVAAAQNKGYILYATQEGNVFAVGYDVGRRQIIGTPAAVLDGATVSVWGGATLFAISDRGTLAYVPGSANNYHVMQLVDRTGRVVRQLGPPRNVRGAMFSPDGGRIAVTVREPGNNDVWLFHTKQDEAERFTLAAAEDEMPVWSHDGQRIAYTMGQSGAARPIMVRSVSARTDPQVVRTWMRHIHLSSWSPDGRWLAAYDYHPINNEDVWIIAAQGTDSIPVAQSPARELNAVFSPNGEWIAYQSDATGRFEVYVVSFPSFSVTRQVSSKGGMLPRWDRSGTALYFLEDGKLLSVPVSTRNGFDLLGAPTVLFATTAFDYDVAPDGRQFLLEIPNVNSPTPPIHIIANWLDEFQRSTRTRK